MAIDVTLQDRLYARFRADTSLPERACRDIARMAVEEFEGAEVKARESESVPVAEAPVEEVAATPASEA